MREKTLLRIAILTTLTGMCMLYVIAETVDLRQEILTEDNLGKTTSIEGEIISIRAGENISTIRVAYEEQVDVIIFDRVEDLEKGDFILVEGKIDQYQGKQQIISDTIKKR